MTHAFVAPLQAAIYSRLSASLELSSRVSAIYDAPVDGAAFPHVAFGETNFTAQDTKTTSGGLVTFHIDVWSDVKGQIQTKEIMALVDAAMHQMPLEIDGCDVIGLRLERSVVREEQLREAGPRLTKGQLSYRVLLFSQ